MFQVLPNDITSEGKEDGDLQSNFEALVFAESKNKKPVASDDRLRTAAPPQGPSTEPGSCPGQPHFHVDFTNSSTASFFLPKKLISFLIKNSKEHIIYKNLNSSFQLCPS